MSTLASLCDCGSLYGEEPVGLTLAVLSFTDAGL
jgi:hypothetical protein